MVKKVRYFTLPIPRASRRPFPQARPQSFCDTRSGLTVRERERREERQVCEPEGQATWRERRWRLFSTFPL
ncbi:MAG: hypothetical protein VST68_00200 [Nitrospirota bacterium]|nr:hypothetical protein [Nitrospirota bacterium]